MRKKALATREEAPPPAPVAPSAGQMTAVIMDRLATGQDMAEMERAFDLAERMMDRERDAATNAAFAQVQAEVTERPVPQSGVYKDDNGRERFRFATIGDIAAHVTPALKRHGFAYTTDMRENMLVLRLLHESGGCIESSVPYIEGRANKMATEQMVARGGVTNAQRRAWVQILGLVEGPDNAPPSVAEAEPISTDQTTELNDLLDVLEASRPGTRRRFLKSHGIAHVDELRATRYTEARDDLRALEAKLR